MARALRLNTSREIGVKWGTCVVWLGRVPGGEVCRLRLSAPLTSRGHHRPIDRRHGRACGGRGERASPTPPRSTSPPSSSAIRPRPIRIQVSAAPGADGIVRRIQRAARSEGSDQLGGVRARQFRRRADRPPDRRAALPHGRLGPVAGPISACRASSPSRRARASRRSGRTAPPPTSSASRSIPARCITFVAELRTDQLPQIYLWEPDAYKDKVNSLTLYHGIVIGIAGLLALFLTILFVVKGSVMFPPPRRSAGRCWSISASTSASGARCSISAAGRRAHLARLGRSDPRRRRCWCSCSPISTSTAGTCATCTSPLGWLAFLGAGGARVVRSADRVRHRAPVAGRLIAVAGLRPRRSICPPTASTARCC